MAYEGAGLDGADVVGLEAQRRVVRAGWWRSDWPRRPDDVEETRQVGILDQVGRQLRRRGALWLGAVVIADGRDGLQLALLKVAL